MSDINKILYEISNHINNNKISYRAISMYLEALYKKSLKLPKIEELSKKLYISPSTISRYVSSLNVENYAVFRYIFNNSQKDLILQVPGGVDAKIIQTAKLIINAKKIYFVGISNSYNINKDFEMKLQRVGIWTINPSDSNDQVGLTKLANNNDLIFITSFSGTQKYLNEIYLCKGQKIMISANGNLFENKIDLLLKVEHKTDDDTQFRTITSEMRINALKIIDLIFFQILKNKTYMSKLKKSSFK